MDCLEFELNDLLEISINEKKFLILRSEGEIFQKACEDVEKMKELQATKALGNLGKIHEIAKKGIDFILGEDAFEEITRGKAVSIPKAIEIYSTICEICFNRYLEYVNNEYMLRGIENA